MAVEELGILEIVPHLRFSAPRYRVGYIVLEAVYSEESAVVMTSSNPKYDREFVKGVLWCVVYNNEGWVSQWWAKRWLSSAI